MPTRALQWLVLAAILVLAVAFVARRVSSVDPVAVPTAVVKPAASSAPTPRAAGLAPGTAKPTTAVPSKPATAPNSAPVADREPMVREATWAPGQLASHFEKHGGEGPWTSESVYDASARETIAQGTAFTYKDRESNAERRGFYDKTGNRFTAVSRDGRRITTHFRPDRGEAYVRGLSRSTYR